jgi:hypothetical protein
VLVLVIILYLYRYEITVTFRHLPGAQAKMILSLLCVGLLTLFLYLGFLLARRSEWAACAWPAFTEVFHGHTVSTTETRNAIVRFSSLV